MSYLAKNYNRKKISFKYGKGSYLYSTDKKNSVSIREKLRERELPTTPLPRNYSTQKNIRDQREPALVRFRAASSIPAKRP